MTMIARYALGPALIVTLTLVALAAPQVLARPPLTFDERVDAQEAIERFYHASRQGSRKPFDDAVPRTILEGKVRKYLDQSVALQTYWGTAITQEALHRELQRIARGTRMPDRLRGLFAALGNDPYMVRECLARPILADRLARNFFNFDDRVHAGARSDAETVHDLLTGGKLDPFAPDPRRSEFEFVLDDTSVPEQAQESARRLARTDFEKTRRQFPGRPGEVGPVEEETDRFLIRTLLAEEPGRVRVAVFSVNKKTWNQWWADVAATLPLDPELASKPFDIEAGELPIVSGGTMRAPCAADDSWVPPSGVSPEARSGHRAVWTGTEMLIWGGSYGFDYLDGYRYDPVLDTWAPLSATGAPSGRSDHAAVWTGDVMIVWGGFDGLQKLNTGGRYDPALDNWQSTSLVNAPDARRLVTGVWADERNEMIVWGGLSYSNTGGLYDPDTDTWTTITTTGAPAGRGFHATVWTGDKLFVWGGRDLFGIHGDGALYDPEADSWTAVSGLDAPSARSWSGFSGVWTGSEVILWAGGWLDDGGRYDPATDSWTPTSTDNAPYPRSSFSAVWSGTEMIIWGDQGNTGGRYDPLTDSWTATSLVNAPSSRLAHSAVWTGTQMIVWGGTDDPHGTGARYDPALDTWTPTASSYEPHPRHLPSVVWTGTYMIVWGGEVGSYNTSSGGSYDALTDTWRPTASLDAPQARTRHTAIWTGDEMIVWGGADIVAGGTLDTGGRYDPTTDTWTATSLGGAPRELHTAVWTGEKMIVWGVNWSFASIYDPDSDSWTQSNPTPNFESRERHTAVWSGTEMIAWGGHGTGYPTHILSYDPDADTWSALNLPGQPAGRIEHTAVWTGDEMIVWGGRDDFGVNVSSGGRYNPATQTWTSTTQSGAPSGRYQHSAVWTGDEMIVWGGSDGPAMDTGGRYDPVLDSWTATSTIDAPAARDRHVAAWTGSWMLIWGGPHTGLGRYALGHSVDNDGDGMSECAGDCDDARATVHAGAPEICDGLNNDCDHPDWPMPTEDADDDGDGLDECGGDCDDSLPDCTTDCTDADSDGMPACAGDCDDSLPGCTTDCTDADSDGMPACAGDCDESNPHCTTDCTDFDIDGYCVTHDCNDGLATVHPGALEVNDGIDNHCPGDPGAGLIDELDGAVSVDPATDELCWTAQPGAGAYEVLRSAHPDFSAGCETFVTGDTCITDPTPPRHTALYYMVRPTTPHLGDWGRDSLGAARVPVCASTMHSWTYGGTARDWANAIAQTTDEGEILVGETESFGAGDKDFWMLKLDDVGNVQWERALGTSDFEAALDVTQTADGGYAVVGISGSVETDAYVVKLNPDGQMLWEYTYSFEGLNQAAEEVVALADGGLLVAGGYDEDLWAFEIDNTGVLQWQKRYGGTGIDVARDAFRTSDGGFVVAGSTNSFGSGGEDVWLLKLDAEGTPLWQKCYGGPGYERGYSIAPTASGGYVVSGITASFGAGGHDYWMLVLDASGSVLWQRAFGSAGDDRGRTAHQTHNGDFVVMGETRPLGASKWDLWILRLDGSGSILWQNKYGHSDTHEFLAAGSDLVLGAATTSFGVGHYDFWVLRMNTDGTIDGSCDFIAGTSGSGLNSTAVPVDTTAAPVSTTAVRGSLLPQVTATISTPLQECTGP